MTEEMQKYLTQQLASATTHEETDRALVNSITALIDCQRKTADRVKAIMIERDREKQRREGAKWLWGVLATLSSTGGGALILAALKHLNF
jgi:hypothetical protein